MAFYYMVLEGLVTQEYREELDFGGRVHKFLANKATKIITNWYDEVLDGCNPLMSEQLIQTCAGVATFPLPQPVRVEKYFKFKFFSKEIDDVIYEVYLVGTIDRVEFDRSTGMVVVRDFKTTQKYDLNELMERYIVSTQFLFYTYALTLRPELIVGDDKMLLEAIRKHGPSIAITLIRRAKQDSDKGWKPAECRSCVPFQHPPSVVHAFADGLRDYAEAVVELAAYRKPAMQGMINDHCGLCDFRNICHAPSEQAAEFMKNKRYHRIQYDPSTFGQINPYVP